MVIPAAARRCSQCGSAADAGGHFCERCGKRLPTGRICAECGVPLDSSARFCTSCGARAIDPNDDTNSAVSCLLAAGGLSLQRADPQKVLEFCTSALRRNLDAVHAATAAIFAMSSRAKLGNFEEAKQYLIAAREFYADHLGLSDLQRSRAVADTCCLFDELWTLVSRDLQDNPWFALLLREYFLLTGGEQPEQRFDNALRRWADFVDENHEEMLGMLAYLYFGERQYAHAANYLERVLLIARKYDGPEPVRIEFLWPLVISGDCYWANNQEERAAEKWQRARSVELCMSSPGDSGSWESLASSWIERAKSRLSEHGIPVPAWDASRQASEHLGRAVECLFEAEQFEERGVDLGELSQLIRRAGRRYTMPLEHAVAELELVERLDRFTWTHREDPYHWWRYESVKGFVLQKTALVHIANEKMALAVATYKQAMELWPILSISAVIGGLQASCGLFADARATYQLCIDRAEELGSVESTAACDEILPEIQQALRDLPS